MQLLELNESCFESLKRYARATGVGGLKRVKRSHFWCRQMLNLERFLLIYTARRLPAG